MSDMARNTVGLEKGTLVEVALQGADQGDKARMMETVAESGDWISATTVAVANRSDGVGVSAEGRREVAADSGDHSNGVLRKLSEGGV
jgi:hypothetical protein